MTPFRSALPLFAEGRPQAEVAVRGRSRRRPQPGALRAGFDLYRAFERDAADIRAAISGGGKLTMPVLGQSGVEGPFVDLIERMAGEIAEDPQVSIVPDCAHWIAEENPQGLVDAVVAFDS